MTGLWFIGMEHSGAGGRYPKAAQGHEQAQQRRDIVAKGISPGQIDEAGRMTREWLTQHQQ